MSRNWERDFLALLESREARTKHRLGDGMKVGKFGGREVRKCRSWMSVVIYEVRIRIEKRNEPKTHLSPDRARYHSLYVKRGVLIVKGGNGFWQVQCQLCIYFPPKPEALLEKKAKVE